MKLHSYLFFDGRCDEAIDFHRSALDAEVEMLMRVNESPEPHETGSGSPDEGNKVMHACLRVDDAPLVMSDGYCAADAVLKGFSLALTVADADEARLRFDALAGGGVVQMPLERTFFSSCFGVVEDRFGVSWMVDVAS